MAVAPMAQPNAEPVEEYEYVQSSRTAAAPRSRNECVANIASVGMKGSHQIFRCCRT